MTALKSEVTTQIVPYIFYRDVHAALDWLAKAFGFVETMRKGLPSGGVHGEMTIDGQPIMMGQGAKEKGVASVRETGTATQGVFIYLRDVDAHCARARAAGAEIARPLEDLPYGRSYTARDLEGHPWFFTTAPADR
jgi:PhnB protein